jgi:hypothetical protein
LEREKHLSMAETRALLPPIITGKIFSEMSKVSTSVSPAIVSLKEDQFFIFPRSIILALPGIRERR